MSGLRWEVARVLWQADDEKDELEALLDDGWEPFAIGGGYGWHIFLRRRTENAVWVEP